MGYKWVLDNILESEIEKLKHLSENGTLILLDYETNGDVENPNKPLSHAHLIKMRIEGKL